jgi:hypothetical protein
MLHTPDMPPFPVNVRAIHYLVERKYLDPPTVKKHDILDRSKADAFAKSISVIQTGWMLVQCVGRIIDSLYNSLLELVTVAFAICTLGTFFF